MVCVKMECERGIGRGDDDGREKKWRVVRELRLVNIEEWREVRLLK